ncbi:MAG: signal recognition particle-docking protein FtsY [Candidatus Heimdallarchaeota archaeon]|nr:signal recognition particle-docking protein FtsY [Candidatus Heimdallarchaeota archaeon]MCK4769301.1 signal recognition particle-docking protein FtsY [Candidatus Heimdallarchaeota archaeon]
MLGDVKPIFDQLRKSVSKLVKKITLTEFSPKSIRKVSIQLKDILIQNEVAVKTADAVCKKLEVKLLKTEHTRLSNTKSLILATLKEVMLEILEPPQVINFNQMLEEAKKKKAPFIVAFFGVNGVGKTLSIAKIGKYLLDRNYSCIFAAADTYRAGSIHQIQKHGENLGIRVIAQTYGSDAAAVAFDAINHAVAKNIDVVLIDTAGRIETSSNLMNELQKICNVAEPDLNVFVGDALTGNSLISQVLLFNEKVGINASILNKMDADVKGGAAVSITHMSQRPILFIGTGQKYTDMQTFVPAEIIDNIVPSN